MFEMFESFSLWGTIVNAIGIILGTLLGLVVKIFTGSKKNENVMEGGFLGELSDVIMKGVAICVLLVGITGAIETKNIMIVVVSIVVGGILGTIMHLDSGITSLGNFIERMTKGKFGSITQGFVTASLIFCVGAMAIVGALDCGLSNDHATLYTKTLLDAILSVILASTLGIGVAFSAALVFIYQGSITLAASWIAPALSDAAVNEMSAVGSLLIIALALNLLGLTKIKVMNYVPAIFIPILLVLFM